MSLINTIRENFATLSKNQSRKIDGLPNNYKAYTFYFPQGYSVGFEFNSDIDINESFSSCKIISQELVISGEPKKFLLLICSNEKLRYEFATLSGHFIEPGENGEHRKKIIEDPLSWWEQWIQLMGNSIRIMKAYDVIGELLAFEELYKTDKNVEWTALNAGSNDIESSVNSYEVKSTVQKYKSEITISSQYQLITKKPVFLLFCRLEKSKTGISVNDMKNRLISLGYDSDKLELQIQRLGFEFGSSSRDDKYKVLEKRKYAVDESFPKITNDSFKDGKFPASIVKIVYTIDLNGIEYTSW